MYIYIEQLWTGPPLFTIRNCLAHLHFYPSRSHAAAARYTSLFLVALWLRRELAKRGAGKTVEGIESERKRKKERASAQYQNRNFESASPRVDRTRWQWVRERNLLASVCTTFRARGRSREGGLRSDVVCPFGKLLLAESGFQSCSLGRWTHIYIFYFHFIRRVFVHYYDRIHSRAKLIRAWSDHERSRIIYEVQWKIK